MSTGDDNDALSRNDCWPRPAVPVLDGKVIGTVDGPCRLVPEPEHQALLQRAELAEAKVERLSDMLRVDGVGRRMLLEGIAAMAAVTPGAQPIWNVCADALCWARKIGPEEAPAADEGDLIAARMKALDDASWLLHDAGHVEAAKLLSERTPATHLILYGRWQRGKAPDDEWLKREWACNSASEAKKPMSLKDTDPEFCKADRLMHELWTHDVGSSGYDKRKWQALEAAILALARRSSPDGGEEQ